MTALSPRESVTKTQFFDISPQTVLRAAKEAYGPSAEVGQAYWLDEEVMRFPIALEGGNLSFGANFHFREGRFC